MKAPSRYCRAGLIVVALALTACEAPPDGALPDPQPVEAPAPEVSAPEPSAPEAGGAGPSLSLELALPSIEDVVALRGGALDTLGLEELATLIAIESGRARCGAVPQRRLREAAGPMIWLMNERAYQRARARYPNEGATPLALAAKASVVETLTPVEVCGPDAPAWIDDAAFDRPGALLEGARANDLVVGWALADAIARYDLCVEIRANLPEAGAWRDTRNNLFKDVVAKLDAAYPQSGVAAQFAAMPDIVRAQFQPLPTECPEPLWREIAADVLRAMGTVRARFN